MIPTSVETGEEREKLILEKSHSFDAYKAYTWGEYYPTQWKSRISGGKGHAGFNFYAFLLTYRWFFFRKMSNVGIVFFAAECLLILSGYLMVEHFDVESTLATFIVFGSIIVMMLASGLLANYLYFKKAFKTIDEYVCSRLPSEYFGEALRSDGGTSLGNVLIFVALSMLFYAIPNLV